MQEGGIGGSQSNVVRRIQPTIMKEGATSQGMHTASEARKSQGPDSLLGPPKKHSPADTFILVQGDPFWTYDF